MGSQSDSSSGPLGPLRPAAGKHKDLAPGRGVYTRCREEASAASSGQRAGRRAESNGQIEHIKSGGRAEVGQKARGRGVQMARDSWRDELIRRGHDESAGRANAKSIRQSHAGQQLEKQQQQQQQQVAVGARNWAIELLAGSVPLGSGWERTRARLSLAPLPSARRFCSLPALVLLLPLLVYLIPRCSRAGTLVECNTLVPQRTSASASATGRRLAREEPRLALSHHALCEPLSQVNDLKLACARENQFIVILEAYYSDLYPEVVCPRASSEARLSQLTGAQLKDIFRQLYSSKPAGARTSRRADLIRLEPTLGAYTTQRPFCLDFDLKQSLQAKCAGRRHCRFNRLLDHQFPACALLKPGHVFARYLCVDDALLVRYCSANDRLGRRRGRGDEGQRLDAEGAQADALDFGFVASPGYPEFYATPAGTPASGSGNGAGPAGEGHCSWTIEGEPGQRVSVKLLDASLAPNQHLGWSDLSGSPLSLTAGRGDPDYLDQYSNLIPASLATEQSHDEERGQRHKSIVRHPVAANTTNVLLELLASAAANETRLLSSLGISTNNRRLVFKIDAYDFEIIKLSMANKLARIASQCSSYDRLLVRDSLAREMSDAEHSQADTSPAGARDYEHERAQDSTLGESNDLAPKLADDASDQERARITRLPVALYQEQLIDFRNESIFQRRGHETPRRIDYAALLDSLNPLQLAWLYQRNVSLCSISQLERLSSLPERNRISFTSTGHSIQLSLITGRKFNPTNRGVLFWYHKHGCPFRAKPPRRSRLLFRNETLEAYKCLENFLFNDTKVNLRVRECDPETQVWVDSAVAGRPGGAHEMPDCVFLEDLVRREKSLRASKSERLTAGPAASGELTSFEQLAAVHNLRRPTQTPVEIVGTAASRPSEFDFELITEGQLEGRARAPKLGRDDAATPSGVLRQLLEIVTRSDTQNGIMTHQPLREQKLGGSSPANSRSWSSWRDALGLLLDRRLLLPALVVLALFLLLNLIIYVIFLVALPKVARCLSCARSPRRRKLDPSSNKLGHYESDYSVSMGMSL